MKYEYIIVDSNNNWLATCDTEQEAKEFIEQIKKTRYLNDIDFYERDTIYVYKAQEIDRLVIKE